MSSMELSPEKLVKLREVIQNQLAQVNIQDLIEDAITTYIPDNQASPDVVMEDLRRKGIVEEILDKLKIDKDTLSDKTTMKEKDEKKKISSTCTDPSQRYLYLHVLNGKAFLEHLNVPEYSESQQHLSSTFMLHIHFRGQRFRSQPVSVACEPSFFEGFLLKLNSSFSATFCKDEALISMCDPIHLILTRSDSDGTTSLISSLELEWRNALTFLENPMNKSVEMMGVGSECKVPVGILDLQLQLIPTHQTFAITSKVIDAQIHLEQQRIAERDRLFLIYAKQWWKEYLQIRDEHKLRPVKIFAQDECGINRPVFAYVQPLDAGRLISTPLAAARFVSAFSYEKASYIGAGNKTEHWQSLHAFLSVKKGDHEDHSNLLCSLLLGFGLEAYVCVGLRTNNSVSTWVVIRYCDGETVFFWDPLTGRRYAHQHIDPDDPPIAKQHKTNHPFKTIGCLYNNKSFYANSQPLDFVETTRFDVDNQSLWKCMNLDAITSVNGFMHPTMCRPLPPIRPPSLDSSAIACNLEIELKALVTRHRKNIDLITEWDVHLSSLLGPSLASYETERSTGLANTGNSDFQDAIRRAVPEGNTFKGFPVQYLHHNAYLAFSTSLKNDVCSEIVECRGDNARLAIRVHVVVFPDDVVATWIMFACRYRSVL